MLGQIGVPTLIAILLLALLLFGPNKLPELGRAFGRTLREFKEGAKEIMDENAEQQAADKEGQRSIIHSSSTASEQSDDVNQAKRLPE